MHTFKMQMVPKGSCFDLCMQSWGVSLCNVQLDTAVGLHFYALTCCLLRQMVAIRLR